MRALERRQTCQVKHSHAAQIFLVCCPECFFPMPLLYVLLLSFLQKEIKQLLTFLSFPPPLFCTPTSHECSQDAVSCRQRCRCGSACLDIPRCSHSMHPLGLAHILHLSTTLQAPTIHKQEGRASRADKFGQRRHLTDVR